MSGELNMRRKLQVILILFLVLACFSTFNWIYWVFLTSVFVILLIVDYMFLDDDQFKFDPIYKNWARKTDPQY